MLLQKQNVIQYLNPYEKAQLIERNKQKNIEDLKIKVNQQIYEKEAAKWENKGIKINQQKYIKSRLEELRDKSQKFLSFRRLKLSMKLKEEHENYKNMIIQAIDNNHNIKKSMFEKVALLKHEKEMERSKFVQEKKEQQFIRNTDELRQIESKIKEIQTYQEQNIQMLEKQNLMEQKYQEEMIFAELNKIELRKKEKDQKKSYQDNKLQIKKERKKQIEEKVLIQKENESLNNEWNIQKEKDQQLKQQKNEFNKQLNQSIKFNNEEIQLRKQYEKTTEKSKIKNFQIKLFERNK
ncbi:hypothetical protein IMG5_121000 [Ichthyophthirius multifiliis]|uniref:Uncharacterized protein n=1 Tax=Ichthyophthirius multifiliis TaxID=5932 RepID=G0QV27_ICHMU|nr:hypothetical protein IMG5_121000 [Ichthyophthirius multifiliis]EGR30934.1 hypothetical protein IMG5_121000 [Ichthyophthirius multifiliis]|eukprot:XP_004032521.1 hypothetical protein IMG5_121000 [Ichthyophthirius multifiliis]